MNYVHIVYVRIEKNKSFLCVDRLFDTGRRDFAMEFPIETESESEEELWDKFEKLAKQLGKSICIDIPELRALMKIE